MNKIFPAFGFIFLSYLLAANGFYSVKVKELRAVQNINEDWQYLEDEGFELNDLENQNNWSRIDLPHTWNQWDVTDFMPGYRRDASWYKKNLDIPNQKDARFILYFECANISSEVYVNKKLAGTHIGGYVGFEIDITPYVKRGQKNEILVKVDNSYNPEIIPSQKSDFFIYGGITRDVWLKIVPEIYIHTTHVSTPEVNEKAASTAVNLTLANPNSKRFEGTLTCEVVAPNGGKPVLNFQKKITIERETETVKLELPELKQPLLWSTEEPQLYTLNVSLEKDGKVIDKTTDRYGYRWFHFEKNGPFFLNGKRLLIRGTHRHEELAGFGSAMSNEQHRRDIEMVKEMGANYLRLGHYPQDPEVYKACDELGIIVWDELPWCRGGRGNENWDKTTKRLLKEQITQNYNHPSILFWSLGNEIYWLPEFPNGGEADNLNEFVTELNDLAHELDPYRMTSIRKYYEGSHLVDVFSPSIWSGWYAGVYKNYASVLEQQRYKYNQFIHMEYGGSSHVGRHTETPIDGDGLVNPNEWTEEINQVNVKNIAKNGQWTENYIVDLFDWHLSVSESSDWFAGNAQWAFKDFGTPLRPENPIPFVNQKGLVDRDGKPKDAYYVFKSYWSDDPFVYIESHTWTERNGPKDLARNVSVFSNCSNVELIQDGNSLGFKNRKLGTFPACGLNWDVKFKEGKNTLIAQGYSGEQLISSDTLTINYSYDKAGTPSKIELSASKLENGNYLIEATMVDKDGKRVLDYEDRVYFSQDGAGELLVNYGTPTRSQVIEMANGKACIELVPSKGKSIIEARNQDFKGSYLVLDFE
ncbi:MAG: glycoside hydrolase family 2 TIM barrel-domain containing protein [Bacteroidota bacterium]